MGYERMTNRHGTIAAALDLRGAVLRAVCTSPAFPSSAPLLQTAKVFAPAASHISPHGLIPSASRGLERQDPFGSGTEYI
jgi:hypothetical protein